MKSANTFVYVFSYRFRECYNNSKLCDKILHLSIANHFDLRIIKSESVNFTEVNIWNQTDLFMSETEW